MALRFPLNNLPLGDTHGHNNYDCSPQNQQTLDGVRCLRKIDISNRLYKETQDWLRPNHQHNPGRDFTTADSFLSFLTSGKKEAAPLASWINAPPCLQEVAGDFKIIEGGVNKKDKKFNWRAHPGETSGSQPNTVWTGTTCQAGWLGTDQPFQVNAPVCMQSWPVVVTRDNYEDALGKRWDKLWRGGVPVHGAGVISNPFYGQCSYRLRETYSGKASGSCKNVALPPNDFYSATKWSVPITPEMICRCECAKQGCSGAQCVSLCQGAYGLVKSKDGAHSIATSPYIIDSGSGTCVVAPGGDGIFPSKASCETVLRNCKTPSVTCYEFDATTGNCKPSLHQQQPCLSKSECCANHGISPTDCGKPGPPKPPSGNVTAMIVGGLVLALMIALILWRMY